jgi:hypothetical protein
MTPADLVSYAQQYWGWGVVGLIAIYLIYDSWKKRRAKKLVQEEREEKAFAPKPLTPTKDLLDQMNLQKEFANVDMMNESEASRLEREKGYVQHEIEEKKQQYILAKERYAELIEIDKRLQFYIHHLVEWEKHIDIQIERLRQYGTGKK